MSRKIVLNADQLRSTSLKLRRLKKKVKRNEIYIVLDNVLDTYNIGSIFRLADAVAAKKIYICGQAEIPPNPRIKKASINTTEVVEWEYCETAVEAVKKVRSMFRTRSFGLRPQDDNLRLDIVRELSNVQIVAIEQTARSISYDKFEYKLPLCLVVGHESDGVSKEVLDLADAVVELPMFGINKSLNVMVSLGIVLYEVIERVKQENLLGQRE